MIKTKQNNFKNLFGSSPIFKVLEFLVINEDFDYSMTEIAKNSEVGYSTLKFLWNKLVLEELVLSTRNIGKAKMYKLNLTNPSMKKFKEFYWEIAKQRINKKIEIKN